MEIASVAREADGRGSDGERGLDEGLPDEEEGHQASPAAGAIGFAKEDVGAAGFGHGGAEFGPDESVEGGEKSAGEPGNEGLWAAHGFDDKGAEHERSDADHFQHVEGDGFLEPEGAGELTVPPGTDGILEHIYSGRSDLAITEAQTLQHAQAEHPLGYLLEAEARWWQIWCLSAEYKYGMSLPRHRGKAPGDQVYLDVVAKAELLAEAGLAKHESAEVHLYAGMARWPGARVVGPAAGKPVAGR